MNRHPQADNLLIAANDKDALFVHENSDKCSIDTVLDFPNYNWTHVKPAYKYQHVKDAWEKDNSLVVQVRQHDTDTWCIISNPFWANSYQYRIKPKTITKRLYANNYDGYILFLSAPSGDFTIPINGTDTEVECE